MDGFNIIQSFFTRMRCNFCTTHLEPEGIELIRHDKGVYIVNVHCVHCSKQMGIALVGLEGSDHVSHNYVDPELTPQELERLGNFEPIDYDDVLNAHDFFSNLDSDWQKFVPEEMRQLEILPEMESEAS